MHRAVRRLFAPAGLAMILLAACGGESAPPETVPAGALEINSVSGIRWEKDTYAATATNGVVLIATINKSSEPHDLHIKDANKVENPVNLDTPKNGDVASAEFRLEPGVYTVFCTITGHGNMVADLTVD
jgi:hypothetical protein